MALLSKLRPKLVLTFGIPVSMVCGFGFAAGLLIAARMDLNGWKKRHLYATGFSLGILGILAVALILSCAILAYRSAGGWWFGWFPALQYFDDVLHVPIDGTESRLVLEAAVAPFALFAGGHALCCLAASNKPGAPEQPEASTPALSPATNAGNLKHET